MSPPSRQFPNNTNKIFFFRLSKELVKTNVTLVFCAQKIKRIKTRTNVSPFVGRLDDQSGNLRWFVPSLDFIKFIFITRFNLCIDSFHSEFQRSY